MEKLRNGKFTHQIATGDEVAAFVTETERMIGEYGWQNRTVAPYGHKEKLTKIVEKLKDYDRCTFGSKQQLISIANGLGDILTAWETQELEPKIAVRLVRNGEIKEFCEEFARVLIEDGAAEAV